MSRREEIKAENFRRSQEERGLKMVERSFRQAIKAKYDEIVNQTINSTAQAYLVGQVSYEEGLEMIAGKIGTMNQIYLGGEDGEDRTGTTEEDVE